MAPFTMHKKLNFNKVLFWYFLATTLLLSSIFYWKIFPECFVDGKGLTPFKKVSEYVIASIFLCSLLLFYKKRTLFNVKVYRLIGASLVLTIMSELVFTLYLSVFDIFNATGHFLRLVAAYLLYEAIISTGLTEPFNLIFLKLKKSEDRLANAQRIAHLGYRQR
jgi:hypothetical protein